MHETSDNIYFIEMQREKILQKYIIIFAPTTRLAQSSDVLLCSNILLSS